MLLLRTLNNKDLVSFNQSEKLLKENKKILRLSLNINSSMIRLK